MNCNSAGIVAKDQKTVNIHMFLGSCILQIIGYIGTRPGFVCVRDFLYLC